MTTRPPEPDLSAHSGGGWSEPGDPGDPGAPAQAGPRYALGAVLGQGGMGIVRAARDQALGRDVALKELRRDLDSPGARARLAREAAITSQLDHPGIVAVHEVGRHEDGRPYYTMRLVRGRSLSEAGPTLPAAARLRHLLAACEAVAAAHDAGMVHRDLKPANILVGPHGETQVIDWGLAAPTPAAAARWAGLPGSPAMGRVGTEAYLAPEQAAGEPPDPRHDVWSLGASIAEVLGEPEPELAAILARCRAPLSDRYPDAGALAEDLQAFFEGRRVAAHSYSAGELLGRVLRAWRAPLLVGLAGLLAVSGAVAWGWWQTGRSRDRAVAAEAEARARLADVQLEQAVEATRAGQRERAERLALAVLETREDPLARGVFASFGRAERPVRVREEAAPDCDWSRLAPGAGFLLCGTEAGVGRHGAGTSWQVPGAWAGASVHGDTVLLWDRSWDLVAVDAATGQERGRWPRRGDQWKTQTEARVLWAGDAPLDGEAVPPSGCLGRLVAGETELSGRSAVACDDGTLYLGAVEDPGRLAVATGLVGEQGISTLALAPQGVVLGSLRGRVTSWGWDGRPLGGGDSGLGLIGRIVASRDGRHAALLGTGGRVGLWRLDSGTLVAALDLPAQDVGFGADGLVVHADGALVTWRLPAGTPAEIRAPGGLANLAVSPDGRRLALAGGSGFGGVVDLADGTSQRLTMGTRVVKAATFGPGGTWFTGMDPPYLARLEDGLVAAGARPLRRLEGLPDGSLVGIDMDIGLFRWRDPRVAPERLAEGSLFVDLEPAEDALVLLDHEGQAWRLDDAGLVALGRTAGARAVAWWRGSPVIAVADAVLLGDRRLELPGQSVLDIAISPDQARLAVAAMDGHVRVYDLASDALLIDLPGHRERAVGVAFLPDGDLASVSWDGTARVAALGPVDRPVAALRAEVEAAWGAE
ncbi:serine/threonine-protein kinase [Myxococcota bacterium]|nr:serine/threonine-protein kinase [Myxococcota bacterium]